MRTYQVAIARLAAVCSTLAEAARDLLHGLCPAGRVARAAVACLTTLAVVRLLGEQGARLGDFVFSYINPWWLVALAAGSVFLLPQWHAPVKPKSLALAAFFLAATFWPLEQQFQRLVNPGPRVVSVFRPSESTRALDRRLLREGVQIESRRRLNRIAGRRRDVGIDFSGFLQAPRTGLYRFEVSCDDRCRVLLGQRILFDQRGSGVIEIPLDAGLHPITIRLVQSGGPSYLRIGWDRPGWLELLPLDHYLHHHRDHVTAGALQYKHLQVAAALIVSSVWWAAFFCLLFRIGERVWIKPPVGVLCVTIAMGGLCALFAWSKLDAAPPWSAVLAVIIVAPAVALVARWLRMPSTAVVWVTSALVFRLLFVSHPDFRGIDLTFHGNQLLQYTSGKLVTSHVSIRGGRELLPIPYPPGLYAVLAPFVDAGEGALASAKRVLAIAMALIESTAPLLVFAVMRAGGASTRQAGYGAIAATVVPESTLVLGKSIAANIAGAWLGLLVVLAILRNTPGPVVAALCAMAFLGHIGSAASLGGLILLWLSWLAAKGERSWSWSLRTLAWVGCGALGAWALYYREVALLTLRSLEVFRSDGTTAADFFQLRWVHVGKVFQNLLLKFGGAPIVIAFVGLRSEASERDVRNLLLPWLWGALVLGLLAVLTPFALRFEYFAAPAVAMAAGLGASKWHSQGRGGMVTLIWGSAFFLQQITWTLLLLNRYDLISVIIPSPRWPWPIALGGP